MGVAALRLSCLATRDEAQAPARAVMTPLAPAAEHCAAGWRWFSLQRQTAGQCLSSLPPCEGRGMGVATLRLSCLATREEGAPARAKN